MAQMEGLAVATGEGAVGRFLGQRMTEQVGQIRLFLQQSDQAEETPASEVGARGHHGYGS